MNILTIVLVLVAVPTISAQICPIWESEPQCYNEEYSSCTGNTIWEEDADGCKMCGGCREYPGVCGACGAKETEPICQPGYHCNNQLKCVPVANTCEAKKHNDCILWSPVCVAGDFAPRQCKGVRAQGRCFCFDKEGNRIFGEQEWAKAENMTCACSRRVQELAETREDVSLHCNEQGNYETLQCDDGLCWCADEKTGVATSRILPDNMMTMLYCYNETEVGSQYLRICESQVVAQSKILMEMKAHGTINPSFPFLQCDRDGTYSAIQLEGNLLMCTWKDNAPLGYAAEVMYLSSMNCRCARDKKKYPSIQLRCTGMGNYESEQMNTDTTPYYVDDDGYLTQKTCASFSCVTYLQNNES